MPWSDLLMQFCLELGFGVLLALAFVPKAPVGLLFYRVMGTTAVVPLMLAIGFPLLSEARSYDDPIILAASLAVLSYPVYSGPVRGTRWVVGLALGLIGTAAATGLLVAEAGPQLSVLDLVLVTLSALATGAVAGSVGLAMVLGHWYLTVPNLEVRHLQRLNRVTVVSMAISAGLVTATCLSLGDVLNTGRYPLFGATGLFYLGTRVVVGLVLPATFAYMAAGSLKYRNTRSATGILYASTVLVLIGTAAAVSLQDSYGVPL